MKLILYCQLKLGSTKNLRSLTQMALYYGQSRTSNPIVEALGVQLVTLGRTSPPMSVFIKKTLTTNTFGQRLLTLMIQKPTQQSVIFPLLILTSIRKTIQIKKCPYNSIETDIYILRNEGNILLMGDFNARTSSNQAILLSNHSNPNPLWLDEDLTLADRYKRSFEYLGENLFGFELVKLCRAQDLIICNGLRNWSNSSQMTCIHGLGSSMVDYVIFDIPLYNEIINFSILKNHGPD